MSLEELTQIEVISFRNRAQKLSEVAGAVYVVTHDQIARSGLNSVPELLRMVPGLHVAQTNGSQWAVGSRGPVGVTQARLLVLIDGRSIYTPIFSGVYWDQGMPMLEDIDRIEVIRGPGATVWGANAVLGVINIVTRHSKDTQGTLVTAGGGTSERAFGRVRFGGTAGSVTWRAYTTVEDHAAALLENGNAAGDGWSAEQAGFRMDGEGRNSSWMLEGSASMNPSHLTSVAVGLPQGLVSRPLDMLNAAGNLTGEYRRAVRKTGELRLNVYFDQMMRRHTPERVAHTRTGNADLRYDFSLQDRHSLSVGAGVRVIHESVPGFGGSYVVPQTMNYANYNTFVQDEISILPDRVYFTLGVKLEHNPFTGWGAEPSASLLWRPNTRNTLWASTARALRTPSMIERAIITPLYTLPASPLTLGLPSEVIGLGSAAFGNEVVTDYQVGYRGDPVRWLSLSISLYRDHYQRIRTYSPGEPALQFLPIPSLMIPATLTNFGDGSGRGVETTLTWQRFRNWKLEGSHTYGTTSIFAQATAPKGTLPIDGFPAPRNQWTVGTSWNPHRGMEVDVRSYWNGHTRGTGFLGVANLEPYTRLDVRLGYKLSEHWTVSASGQNLLSPQHVEGQPETLTDYSYIRRAVVFKSEWRF